MSNVRPYVSDDAGIDAAAHHVNHRQACNASSNSVSRRITVLALPRASPPMTKTSSARSPRVTIFAVCK